MSDDVHGQVERFGDIAVEMGFLSEAQVGKLLERQKHYKDMGIPMRLDTIGVELGIISRADCQIVLKELRNRRRVTRPKSDRPEPYADEDLVIPCTLGHFEIEERLGGVMGAVYRAFDKKLNKHVALKLLPKSLSHDRNLVQRFHREARASGKLSHPNVVEFYEAGEVEGRFYISMEYVDGECLTERIERDGKLSERESLGIVRELAHALYHAHVNGLLHRDVKPDNVIIDRAGRVRLTDLGLAKVLTEDTKLTESGIAIGTPHYISPEQARGDKVIDRRADLYGLGATLFHLLCGRPLFEGNAAEVMRKHVFVAPPDPRAFAPDIGSETHHLVLKLLAKDPNQRIQSADALIATINTILKSGHTHVKVESSRIVQGPVLAPPPGAATPEDLEEPPEAEPYDESEEIVGEIEIDEEGEGGERVIEDFEEDEEEGKEPIPGLQ